MSTGGIIAVSSGSRAEVEAGGFVDALLCAWGCWVCPSCQTYVDQNLECMCEITGTAHTPRPL